MEYFELWKGGVRLAQSDKAMAVTTDSVLLADFAFIPKSAKICDLGAGGGILALILLFRSKNTAADLVELSAEACGAARENVALNGFESRAEVINADLRLHRGRYDLVITNPPYFAPTGGRSPDDERRSRRTELTAALYDVCEAGARLLGDGGRFAMVYPAQRMAEALRALSENKLEPKRLRLVEARIGAKPSVFLVECVRSGKPGLVVEPTLILKNPDGTDTDEVKKIYHIGE